MAPDIDAARAFYHAVFGWEYDIGGSEFGGDTTARLGQRMVSGLMGLSPARRQCQQPGVGNIDDSPFGRIAALADPTGALFKVVEPPKS
jgi:predicted enzyme related to lactoylglutathione lyase